MASGLQAVSGEVVQLGMHLHGPPPLPDRVVPRPRVADAIAERIERHPLVQVIASAGSGKTTAVVQAVERLDRPVTWLTIEDWHRSATRLLDSLIEALERIAPGLTNQVTRARAEDTDTVELAAIASSFVRRHDAVLVVDDCHLLLASPEAVSVLSALVRRGASGLHVVLLGRALVPLVGVGVDALAPDATVGDDLLRAERKEAEEILLEHGATVDVDEAVEATGGWLAGLLFESWGSREGGAPSLDPLGEYLEREIRPRLGHDAYDQLVASSIFDDVDAARAEAIGAEDPRAWLASLRLAGVPATWAPNGQHMRLHPRVRELLRAALAMGPGERRRTVERTAAETYEHEGRLEDALELYLDLGETARADVLLPAVLPGVVERHDVPLAERLLGSTRLDPEPARITLARLTLASLKLEGRDALTTLNRLEAEGRLDEAVAEEPAIGALGCNFLLANGEINRAADLQSRMPGGRAADVARLLLSAVRDDPRAPVPAFQGDALDAVLARALYHRGLLRELRTGRTSWSETSGTHDLDTQTAPDGRETPKRFTTTLARFARAISERNLEDARRCVSALEGVPFYQRLAEVELAVRLERDPGHARAALEALSEDRVSAAVFYAEVLDAWDGAVRLLEDDPAGAAPVLREAVASMRRGDRILQLPSALVYLAEAEWRLGEEEASDRATDDAYEVARRQGSLRELLLALADVPGVLSRRIDAEPAGDSRWHALGRTLVAGSHASPGIVAASAGAHLREFGEPGLVVHGCDVRPKIRKSLELLSYLLLAPTACVSREDVLNALWNGRDDDSTRAYLRQALRHLRDVLPDGISVTAVSDSLSIEGAVTSESLELEALLAEAARDAGPGRLGYLLEALELGGRGLFLEGSSDVRWVDDHRSRIESVLADARLDAAELLLEAERHLRALTLVDEALDADPLLERAWRLRMRTLDLLGDNDGVTAAYAACARALAEIGLEPSGQTRELARALRS